MNGVPVYYNRLGQIVNMHPRAVNQTKVDTPAVRPFKSYVMEYFVKPPTIQPDIGLQPLIHEPQMLNINFEQFRFPQIYNTVCAGAAAEHQLAEFAKGMIRSTDFSRISSFLLTMIALGDKNFLPNIF